MNTHSGPPNYLTASEFARLRFSDEQWLMIEALVAERTYEHREESRIAKVAAEQVDRVVHPLLAAFLGLCLSAPVYVVVQELTGSEMSQLWQNPLSFLLWTGVVAWLMRKK